MSNATNGLLVYVEQGTDPRLGDGFDAEVGALCTFRGELLRKSGDAPTAWVPAVESGGGDARGANIPLDGDPQILVLPDETSNAFVLTGDGTINGIDPGTRVPGTAVRFAIFGTITLSQNSGGAPDAQKLFLQDAVDADLINNSYIELVWWGADTFGDFGGWREISRSVNHTP